MAQCGRNAGQDGVGDPISTESITIAGYRALLERYKHSLNLVATTNEEIIDRGILEAAAYADILSEATPERGRIADLGSGAGLPAIVIAARLPTRTVYLIERRRRRVAFLRMAVAHLALANAKVIYGDATAIDLPPCHAVVAQAVGSLSDVYCATRRFQADRFLLVSRKGDEWPAEVGRLERRIGEAPELEADRPLGGHGRLIALRLSGGRPCRSSV